MARDFHRHRFDPLFLERLRQRPAVAPEAAELAGRALHRYVGSLNRRGDDMQHAAHLDSGDMPAQGLQSQVFHRGAPVVTVGYGTQGHRRIDRSRKAHSRRLGDSPIRFRAPFVLRRFPQTVRPALCVSRAFEPARCRSDKVKVGQMGSGLHSQCDLTCPVCHRRFCARPRRPAGPSCSEARVGHRDQSIAINSP
jgi:hypothetical protein